MHFEWHKLKVRNLFLTGQGARCIYGQGKEEGEEKVEKERE